MLYCVKKKEFYMTIQAPDYCTNFTQLRTILKESSNTFIADHKIRLGRKFSWNFFSLEALKSNIRYIFDSIFNNPRSQANTADYNRARNVLRSVNIMKSSELSTSNRATVAIAFSILQSKSTNFKSTLLPAMITLEQDKSGNTGGFYPDAAFGNKAFHRNEQMAYVFAQVLSSYNDRLTACNELLGSDIKKLNLAANVKVLDEMMTQKARKGSGLKIMTAAAAQV